MDSSPPKRRATAVASMGSGQWQGRGAVGQYIDQQQQQQQQHAQVLQRLQPCRSS